MPSDEQIVSARYPKHLYANQHRCYHDRVHAVYADTVHALKPRQSLASFINQARVSTEIGNRSARFHSAKHIFPGQILMLNRNRRLAVNAGISQAAQHDLRQPQSLSRQDFGFWPVSVRR
jgi:hypothetical protein